MTVVNARDTATDWSRLLERVEAGERIVIARDGQPIAELTPIARRDIVFGGMKGEIVLDDDEFVAADAEIEAMWDDIELH